MIELNIQDIRTKAKLSFIDSEGKKIEHVFGVRRRTNGDLLALSEIARKQKEIYLAIDDIVQKVGKLKDDDAEGREKLLDESDKLTKEMEKTEAEETRINARVFDDFGDQKLSLELYNSLAPNELETILKACDNAQEA